MKNEKMCAQFFSLAAQEVDTPAFDSDGVLFLSDVLEGTRCAEEMSASLAFE